MWSGNVSLMFIQVHLVQSKSLSPFPMHRYLLCTLWILYHDNAFAILLLFSLTSSNSFLFSWRHCFFLAKNKIMTRNGTFLLAKATSTATLARSPRVTIVPYMKMKQYWAKGRILVQRGDVSRGNAFFNQTGNCSSPSPFVLPCLQSLCLRPLDSYQDRRKKNISISGILRRIWIFHLVY